MYVPCVFCSIDKRLLCAGAVPAVADTAWVAVGGMEEDHTSDVGQAVSDIDQDVVVATLSL